MEFVILFINKYMVIYDIGMSFLDFLHIRYFDKGAQKWEKYIRKFQCIVNMLVV